MLPQIADILTYLKGLKPQNLMGTAFGSYGWSGEATRQIQDMLAEFKGGAGGENPSGSKMSPTLIVLAQCFELGKLTAKKIA